MSECFEKDLIEFPEDFPETVEIMVDESVFTINCRQLATVSQFFYALLTADFKEKQQKRIKLGGICSHMFNVINDYLHSGRITCSMEDALDFYDYCDYFMVNDSARVELNEFILENYSSLGVSVWDLYNSYTQDEDIVFTEKIANSIHTHFEEFFNDEQFLKAPRALFLKCLPIGRHSVFSEADGLVKIASKWLAFKETRIEDWYDVLSILDPHQRHIKMPIPEWNVESIQEALVNRLVIPQYRRIWENRFYNLTDPVYLSNIIDWMLPSHFDGCDWSSLKRPNTELRRLERIKAAARRQADLYVYYQDFDDKTKFHFTYQNINRDEVIELTMPSHQDVKALYFIDNRLYSCTGDVIQQYCEEMDLWLKPIKTELDKFEFCTCDGRYIYVSGVYDQGKTSSFHMYNPRDNTWSHILDYPERETGLAGIAINGEMYVAKLDGPDPYQDVRYIDRVDFDNEKWERILTITSKLGRLFTMTSWRGHLVMIDGHNDLFMADLNQRRWVYQKISRHYFTHTMTPVYTATPT